MRSLKLTTLGSALALIASAVAIFGTAAAEARTTGFHIWNLTAEPVKLVSIDTIAEPNREDPVFSRDSDAPKPPKVGTVIQSGEELHIEIENPIGYTRRAEIQLQIGGEREGDLELEGGYEAKCRRFGSSQCAVDGGRVEILERPGSEHVITSKNIQAQAKALKVLCTEQNKCEYEPLEELEAQSPKEYFGSSLANCAPLGGPDVTHTIGVKDTVKISNSVGLDVSTEFTVFKVFKTSITLKYKHERTDSHEFTEDVVVPVPPHYVSGVMVTQPVIRDIGDFTLNLGNTKWVLKGVFFDSPDLNPKRRGNYATQYHKLTPKEFEAECPESEEGSAQLAGLVKTSASLFHTGEAGSAAADLMRGGPESNLFRGLGGDDIIRGGGGHDTLLGGPGTDLIKGGPGEDAINGGPGPDRIDDVSGPTTVRTGSNPGPAPDRVDVADGKGDDTVACESVRTTVLADPGDEVTGECGQVIRKRT